MKNAVRNVLSRPVLQPVLEKMLKLCHAGLNYGGGQTVEQSGELGALEFVRKTVRSSSPLVLFDVGANNGGYLNAALNVLGAGVEAHSFEPASATFESLCKRFANDPRVKLRRVALGRVPGFADLFFGAEADTTASLNRNVGETHRQAETVEVTTVDEVCKTEGVAHIDLLKIDTEGYEMEVLLGAAGMIARHGITAIQFEFGETFLRTEYHFIDLWEMLSPRYRMYRILRRGMQELTHYAPDQEIYKIANFLCVWNG
jgi:FkbM family methyltransferase